MSIFDNLKKAAGEAVSSALRQGESREFTFAALPESVEELKALPEAELSSPFQTAALTVCALCAYAAAPEIGIDMLNYLKGPQSLSEKEKQFLKDRFRGGTHIPFSHFAGATPENNYTPSKPFRITVTADPHSYDQEAEGYVKLFIRSGGADSPRPVVLRRKGEQWFLWEQLLMSGIRTPKSADPWA